MVEDVGKSIGRKCDSTGKGCIKKFPWLSQIEQRKYKRTLHPEPYTPPYTEL